MTTQRLARDRTQVPKLTSNQLVFPMDRLAYHRMYVIELTSNELRIMKYKSSI
ncbi:MAG: hypothetical protein HXN40_07870 [Prevotella histicola]|uniref:hypothetical protein n=1 Tax=Prevotella histicola TaxID=470565 RepID=UPI001CB38357|nr:hypothetical protein [Prevotella histicola]MBF1423477.1 hypothetical protein [Prevotella histicola]